VERYDQHLHSLHSFDCETPPIRNVEAAISKGLHGITFTEHFDTHPDEWPECRYDDAAYTADLEALRSSHGDRLAIGKGIEICFQPQNWRTLLEHVERHDFDMVILSVHWSKSGPIHLPEWWQERGTLESACRDYFETVLQAARMVRDLGAPGEMFQVLGHLDLVKRYAARFRNTMRLPIDAVLLDEVLGTCLEAELIPEINASTLIGDDSAAMPGPEIVARYASLGGTCMTIGSDAHEAHHIGWGFDVSVEVMREAGLTGLAVFEDRQRRVIALESCSGPA
jgi:histidinol-phosphatase (PHP family)